MTGRRSMHSARRVWVITAILAALFLLVPVGATTAYLTAKDTADPTSGGVGRWCSVPNPAQHPNVYRLNEFDQQNWGGSEVSHMIIVPVVRNGEFGTGGGDGRLGVRTWACDASKLTSTSSLKVTAWRNGSASADFKWLTPKNGSGLPSQRLSPASGFGQTVSKFHRNGTSGGTLRNDDRQLYSWLLSSGRSKSEPTKVPPYTTLTHNYDITPAPTFAAAFNGYTDSSRKLTNSVAYRSNAYWKDAGTWTGSLLSPPTVQPVNLAPYGNNLSSSDGRQVQWVVMEWWGSTTPSNDMVIEVFVE